MTPEQWQSCWGIYRSAVGMPEPERSAYLDSATPDPVIRQEVRKLLNALADDAEDDAEFGTVRTGTQIGKYLVGELLGSGGMGQVYSAVDTELKRPVALKFLSQDSFGNRPSAKRFIAEARATSGLNHPNIVTVYEVIQSGPRLAIAMELVEGVPLRRYCGETLAPEQVMAWGWQIALALSAAHEAGVVHRDIKPENVVVRPDGLVKVLDFGLAREIAPEGGELSNSTAGIPTGTIRYMSPQQLRGERLTAATDVFSLGIVLYELTAGRHPFEADHVWQTAHAITAKEPVPPTDLNSAIPRELAALIMAMLSKEALARPSITEVARVLAGEQAAPRLRPSWKRRWRYAAAAAVLLGVIGLSSAILTRSGSREPVIQELTRNVSENPVTAAAISPDGSRFCYADASGVFLRDMAGGIPAPVEAPDVRFDRFTWLADGTGVVASGFEQAKRKHGVWILRPGRSAPQLIRENAREASVSPDGRQVAFTTPDGTEVLVAPVSGGAARTIATDRSGRDFAILLWSPDGRQLGYLKRRDGSYDYEWIDLRAGKVTSTEVLPPVDTGAISADGRVFLLRWANYGDSNLNVWEQNMDWKTGTRQGPARQLTRVLESRLRQLTVSANGRRIVVLLRHEQPDVFVGDFDASGPGLTNIQRLTFDNRGDYPHAWTPDGKSVIFESDRGGGYDLYHQSPEERIATPVAPGGLEKVMAQASPDGRWILFMGFRDSPAERALYRTPVPGGAVEEVPTGGRLDEFRCAQPGGRRCVLRTKQDGKFVFSELDPVKGRGRELVRLTLNPPPVLGDWALSSAGSEIAIPIPDERLARFRLVKLDGAEAGVEREVVIDGHAGLTILSYAADDKGWFAGVKAPSGRQLVYVGRDGRAQVLRETQGLIWGIPSPDGRKLAFVDHTKEANAARLDLYP